VHGVHHKRAENLRTITISGVTHVLIHGFTSAPAFTPCETPKSRDWRSNITKEVSCMACIAWKARLDQRVAEFLRGLNEAIDR